MKEIENFKKWMLIFSQALIVMMVVCGACAAGLEEMELVAENAHLALYIHPDTTEIAVFDKTAEEVWYSIPLGGTCGEYSP